MFIFFQPLLILSPQVNQKSWFYNLFNKTIGHFILTKLLFHSTNMSDYFTVISFILQAPIYQANLLY